MAIVIVVESNVTSPFDVQVTATNGTASCKLPAYHSL